MCALPFVIEFLEFFSDLPDTRQRGKILYPLNEMILTTLCAVICGADSYVEVEEFGNAKLPFLKNYLPFEQGIPSHDTFGIVFSKIDSAAFNTLFIEWVEALQKTIPKLVAIDGKTIRRSRDGESKPIHVVSAWAVEQNLVLGQCKTGEKSNEITAIPELLSLLVLNGAIVSIDAMGCQKDIAKAISDKKADYVLAVKGNQPGIYNEIELFFQGISSGTLPIAVQSHKTIDKDHGRIETRNYLFTDTIEWLNPKNEWSGLKSIGCVHAIREISGVVTEEYRYFISSLSGDIQLFAQAVRGHWGVENSLHWVMDIAFRDDECRIRKKHGPANFVTIKHIAQNMMRSVKSKASMRVKRKKAGWDDTFLDAILKSKLGN